MLPAAIAIAMVGFIGAFGSTPSASAAWIDGDVCEVDWWTPDNVGQDIDDSVFDDGQDNYVGAVENGGYVAVVFRLYEDSLFDMPNVTVRIDSETGSARFVEKAEIVDEEDGGLAVDLVLLNGTGTTVVDTIDPDTDDGEPEYFTDPDGNPVDDINDWLESVAGLPGFVADPDENACGGPEDLWGMFAFECIEAGYVHIDILTPDDTEEEGATGKFFCYGQPDKATIAASRTTVETDPTEVDSSSYGQSIITVTVEDQFGDRIDGAEVTFSTDNCTFDATADGDITPAAGGTTVTVWSDTDTTSDLNFVSDNPLEKDAGTAEVELDCTKASGKPGVANITAIVQRPGSDIVLKTTVTVVGPTSATGLTLTLTPDDVECGETILATATAVDALGQPVSAGTSIYFTTDTSSGVVGGEEGAQGYAASDEGEASVLIATDPGNPGIHTVIAYTMDSNGRVLAQVSETYTCDGAVAPVAPTVNPPTTGTGTGSITPPNTGDAGLAAGSTSSSLFVIAGAVAFVLAGLASVRFARN
jgi:hypothetical protein